MSTEFDGDSPPHPGTMKINWKKVLVEIIKVIIAALAGAGAATAM